MARLTLDRRMGDRAACLWVQTTFLQRNLWLKTLGLVYYGGFSTELAGGVRRLLWMLWWTNCTSTKPLWALSSTS